MEEIITRAATRQTGITIVHCMLPIKYNASQYNLVYCQEIWKHMFIMSVHFILLYCKSHIFFA